MRTVKPLSDMEFERLVKAVAAVLDGVPMNQVEPILKEAACAALSTSVVCTVEQGDTVFSDRTNLQLKLLASTKQGQCTLGKIRDVLLRIENHLTRQS